MKFFGTVKQGRFLPEKPALIKEYMSKHKEGTRMMMELGVQRKGRTTPQNKYYWQLLTIIGDELGYDKDEMHATFRSMFLTDRSLKVPLVRSTTKLDTLQMGTYIDKIKMFCQDELGIVLPSPDEIYE